MSSVLLSFHSFIQRKHILVLHETNIKQIRLDKKVGWLLLFQTTYNAKLRYQSQNQFFTIRLRIRLSCPGLGTLEMKAMRKQKEVKIPRLFLTHRQRRSPFLKTLLSNQHQVARKRIDGIRNQNDLEFHKSFVYFRLPYFHFLHEDCRGAAMLHMRRWLQRKQMFQQKTS